MIYIYKDEKQPGKFYYQLTVDDLETGKKKKYKQRGLSSEKEARKAAMNFVSDQNTKKYNGIQFDGNTGNFTYIHWGDGQSDRFTFQASYSPPVEVILNILPEKE